MRRQGLAEDHALLGVLDRLVQGLQRGADALEADHGAVHVEEAADADEGGARLADHRVRGHLHVLEPHRAARNGAAP